MQRPRAAGSARARFQEVYPRQRERVLALLAQRQRRRQFNGITSQRPPARPLGECVRASVHACCDFVRTRQHSAYYTMYIHYMQHCREFAIAPRAQSPAHAGARSDDNRMRAAARACASVYDWVRVCVFCVSSSDVLPTARSHGND